MRESIIEEFNRLIAKKAEIAENNRQAYLETLEILSRHDRKRAHIAATWVDKGREHRV